MKKIASTRLAQVRSWLGGHAPQELYRLEQTPDAPVPPAPLLPAAPAAIWPAARLATLDGLWGEGFLIPGGAAEISRLVAPLGLSPAATLLLAGMGMGGPARVLVENYGVWVAGFEADEELLADATARQPHSGPCAKRITLLPWVADAPGFRRTYHHHALVVEGMRHMALEPLVDSIAAALKPHGQLVLVDLVADQPLDPTDPLVAAWSRLDRRGADLPTEAAVTRVLTRNGFDVRVAEDISRQQERLAIGGWRELLHRLAMERPPPRQAAALVAEAELWLLRLRLLHGGMRLMRWHGIRAARSPVV